MSLNLILYLRSLNLDSVGLRDILQEFSFRLVIDEWKIPLVKLLIFSPAFLLQCENEKPEKVHDFKSTRTWTMNA